MAVFDLESTCLSLDGQGRAPAPGTRRFAGVTYGAGAEHRPV